MIKEIPKEDRPRERLIRNGVNSLSNSELLAILIKTGTKDCSSINLAHNILNNYKDVSELKNIKINTLKELRGIGEVKAITLLAAIELGRRVYKTNKIEIKHLNNPLSVFEYFSYELKDKKQEHFYTIYLNSKKEVIDIKLLFIGTLNISVVHPREIFKEAYLLSADSIICVHNHPSGDVTPSSADIKLTNRLVEISYIQGIKIVDHIIVGQEKYYSFFENGRI